MIRVDEAMMQRSNAFRCSVAVILGLGLVASASFGQPQAHVFPGNDWERIETPEAVGFSSVRLQALRPWLQALDTTAMIVVVGGRSLFEYGDLSHRSCLGPVRKNIAASQYRTYVDQWTFERRRRSRR